MTQDQKTKVTRNERTHEGLAWPFLRLRGSTAGGTDLTPGWEDPTRHGQKKPDASTRVYFSSFILGFGALDLDAHMCLSFLCAPSRRSAAFLTSCLFGTSSRCRLNCSSDLRNHPYLAYLFLSGPLSPSHH